MRAPRTHLWLAVVAMAAAVAAAVGVVAPNAVATTSDRGPTLGRSPDAVGSLFDDAGLCAGFAVKAVGQVPAVCSKLALLLAHPLVHGAASAPMAPTTPPGGKPLPCAAAAGWNDRCESWAKEYIDTETYANYHADTPSGMVLSPHGDRAYMVATTAVDGVNRLTLAAFDTARGSLRWVVHGPDNPQSGGLAIAISRDGRRLFVTGFEKATLSLTSTPYFSFLTRAYSASNGKLLWSKIYRGLGGHTNAGFAIAVSNNGRTVYVTGVTDVPGPFQVAPIDIATLAYQASNGKVLWGSRFNGQSGANLPVGLTLSPRGDRLFVTGTSQYLDPSPTPLSRYVTMSYDTRHGREQWVQYYNGVQHGTNSASGIALSSRADRVFVTGTAQYAGTIGAPRSHQLTIAYNARSGRELWQAGYVAEAGGTSSGATIDVAPKGDIVYVGGAASRARSAAGQSLGSSAVATTLAFNAVNGKRRWVATYQPSGLSAVATVVTAAPSGRVYTAFSLGEVAFYPGAAAYDGRTGGLKWLARYDVRDPGSAGGDAAVAQAVNPRSGALLQLNAMSPTTNLTLGLVCSVQGAKCPSEPVYPLLLAYAK